MSSVASPCVSICALDDDDVCVGCYRHTDEIAGWSELTDEARREVLVKAAERCRQANRHLLL